MLLPVGLAFLANCYGCAQGSRCLSLIVPEERTIKVGDSMALPRARIPEILSPPTVTHPQIGASEHLLSLDEAIRIAIEHSEVVRVLAGVRVGSSGATIYDSAIANVGIDEERGRFDPTIDVNNTFNRTERPEAHLNPLAPAGSSIGGIRTDDYGLDVSASKTNLAGGDLSVGLNTNASRFRPGIFALNPQDRSSLELSYVQPLLRGGGIGPNVAPIVLARIETERSYFQFKDSVQELVRGVIEAYWSLVFSRTEVWAIERQVEQGQEAFDREVARKNRGFGEQADVAQTRLALANFRASLITAEANLLQREAALRNILGLPPTDDQKLIPTTSPFTDRLEIDWDELLNLAEEHRPDLIELKLIIEADEQLLVQARNQALPNVDAVMLYRWNGLEGETPSGANISSDPDQFTDWTLGVNFSVPLGLRASRAALRRRELIIARDRANLQQAVHSMVHTLAGNVRNLDQFYEQYQAFLETREAAQENLNQQLAENRRGRAIFLNVLQAITEWGDAVTSEAQSLIQYETELASLERQTGTILETHGIRFFEERYRSIGPLGAFGHDPYYPKSLYAGPNTERYGSSREPAENSFDLIQPTDPPNRKLDLQPVVPTQPSDENASVQE